jgi:hypothetical protein
MKKWFTIIVVFLAIAAGGFYATKWYLRSKPKRDVTKETAVTITAQTLWDAYNTNEVAADSLYGNKAVQVSGVVKKISQNQDGNTVVLLETGDPIFGVNCTFKETPNNISEGSTISFKGICTGFLSSVTIKDGVLIP